MKSRTAKYFFWISGLLVYLLLAIIFFLVFSDGGEKSLSQTEDGTELPFADSEELNGILLPLGPYEGPLPGLPEIWSELLRVGKLKNVGSASDGFDGLQAVKNVEALSKGSQSDLFLSTPPRQVFRRGKNLLVLNSQSKVQIINCENPREPMMAGVLPYKKIKHMEMRGNIAYLLLGQSNTRIEPSVMAVVDLRDPLKPRLITQVLLPAMTMFFFFMDQQLVVYTISEGYREGRGLYLYDLTEDYLLIPRGSAQGPYLQGDFVKQGNYLLFPDLRAGITLYDFSNPLHPVVTAALFFPEKVRQLSWRGDLVLAMGEQKRMYVIDLHDLAHPALTKVVEEANFFAYLAEYDGYLYYFSHNAYLRVFHAQPTDSLTEYADLANGLAGELVPLPEGAGFLLLGEVREPPASVTEVLALPGPVHIIDSQLWQGMLVVLDDQGLLQFFHQDQASTWIFRQSLALPERQRWLAVSQDRLYAGGESTVNIIAHVEEDTFALSGELKLPVAETSWDGLVVQEILCIAVGGDGLSCFSLEDPDHPIQSPAWQLPGLLEVQVEARQLASPGGNRLLVAAGTAGLLSGHLEQGQYKLDAAFKLKSQANAIATIGGLCLVSTDTEINVIDVRSEASLQNLGKIAFAGVTRFATGLSLWAGYAPDAGWFTFPAPQCVPPEEIKSLSLPGAVPFHDQSSYRYRLNLFNSQGVITTPKILSLSGQWKSTDGTRL